MITGLGKGCIEEVPPREKDYWEYRAEKEYLEESPRDLEFRN